MTLSVCFNSQQCRLAVISVLALPLLFLVAILLLPGGPDNGGSLEAAPPAQAGHGAQAFEPRLPLDISWNVTDADPTLPGTSLTLVLTAATDLPSVRFELLLPEQATLLAGTARFQGKLSRGEKTVLPLRIAYRGATTIQARVIAVTSSGLSFRRGASLDLGADDEPPVRISPGRLLRAPDGGRQILEFPAVPPAALPGLATGEVGR